MKWEKASKWYTTWGYIGTLPAILIMALAVILIEGTAEWITGRVVVCTVIAIGMAIKGLSNLKKSRRDPAIK